MGRSTLRREQRMVGTKTLCVLAIVLAVACAEEASLDGDAGRILSKIGESLEQGDLGEGAGAPKSQLAAQNQQLEGAIQAIEGGTPPPGMEAMLGGAGAAPSGGQGAAAPGKANTESAAISKGIKMAMASVKPLMDKYVATARALTDKYTALQRQYKALKAKYDGRPSKASLMKSVNAAKAAEDAKWAHKMNAADGKAAEAQAAVKAADSKEIDRLTAKLAQCQAFVKSSATDFKVQLKMARQKAKANVQMLHNQLKDMMMDELRKRDKAAALKASKAKIASIKKKQAAEVAEKKDAEDAAMENRKKIDAREKVDKREAQAELKAKNAAAQEVKTLNRNTVMRKARVAMDEARRAAHMARTLVRNTARNLDDARLSHAKATANDDIKALDKLRQHEDLARGAIESAKSKKRVIARFQYSANAAKKKAEKRLNMVKKQNRWDARHAATTVQLAVKARDKAKLLKDKAEEAAAVNGIRMPKGLHVPTVPKDPTPKSSGETKAEKKAVKALAGNLPKAAKESKKESKKKESKKKESKKKESKKKGIGLKKAKKKEAKLEAKKQKLAAKAKAAKKAKTESLNSGRGERKAALEKAAEEKVAAPLKKVKRLLEKLPSDKKVAVKVAFKADQSKIEKVVAKQKNEPDKEARSGLRRPGTTGQFKKQSRPPTAAGHKTRENVRIKTRKAAGEIKAIIADTTAEMSVEQKKAALVKAAGKSLVATAKTVSAAKNSTKFAGKLMSAVEKDADETRKKAKKFLKTDSARTAAVKVQSAAALAALKSNLANAKIAKAKVLRREARAQLKRDGKPIPADLKKGSFASVEQRAKEATVQAKDAIDTSAKNTKLVKSGGDAMAAVKAKAKKGKGL